MRILVTGSRRWSAELAVSGALWSAYAEHGPFTLVHGACATGADFYAHRWFETTGRHAHCEENRFPASWEAYGRAAGPMRNEQMIRAGADLCLAFPLPGGRRTAHTMRLAHEAGIPVRTYNEDGSVQATRWGWRADGTA